MRKILFALPLLLAACSGVPSAVSQGCADVSVLQPIMKQAADLLGKDAAIVKAVYTAVEAGCLKAPEVAGWLQQLDDAMNGVKPVAK